MRVRLVDLLASEKLAGTLWGVDLLHVPLEILPLQEKRVGGELLIGNPVLEGVETVEKGRFVTVAAHLKDPGALHLFGPVHHGIPPKQAHVVVPVEVAGEAHQVCPSLEIDPRKHGMLQGDVETPPRDRLDTGQVAVEHHGRHHLDRGRFHPAPTRGGEYLIAFGQVLYLDLVTGGSQPAPLRNKKYPLGSHCKGYYRIKECLYQGTRLETSSSGLTGGSTHLTCYTYRISSASSRDMISAFCALSVLISDCLLSSCPCWSWTAFTR